MKNYLLVLSLLLIGLDLQAQAPPSFNYQAVVRDADGQILSNQAVGLQISLIANNGVDTSTVYMETHTATTNAFGLVNLEIGRGTEDFGQFDTLDWSQATFIRIGLDLSGGSNYQEMGTAELLSVPYALYASAGGSSELPSDAQTGDIAFYDGSGWQRLAAGAPGTVLTMGPDGLPIWQALPTPLDSLLEVTLPNGETIYAHPRDNSDAVPWGPSNDITDLPNITAKNAANMDFDGKENTEKIVAQLGDNNGMAYAAKICDDLEAFGFDDWYLPAAAELNELYKQLGPTDNGFGGSGDIPSGVYWSSSEADDFIAWGQVFDNGGQSFADKDFNFRCRCVRR